MSFESFLRDLHASTAISWRTTSPFAMRDVEIKRIGFGHIPVCEVSVSCKDITAMVPIVRQYVYHELLSQGVPVEAVEFIPTVQTVHQRRKFVDLNESSETKGKNVFGLLCEFHFHIEKEYLSYFVFEGSRGMVKASRE